MGKGDRMRKVLMVLGGMVLVIALGIAVMVFATSGSREIARTFVMEVSAGNPEAAHDLFHDGLKEVYTVEALQEAFEGYAAYESVSFYSLSTSPGGTDLEGTATTASECSTQVSISLVDEQIISFEMNPLCPE